MKALFGCTDGQSYIDVNSACDGCRAENHKEAKRKREEIKWDPGSAQKAKKSRGDRAGSREHKHKHKEKCALIPLPPLHGHIVCTCALHLKAELLIILVCLQELHHRRPAAERSATFLDLWRR